MGNNRWVDTHNNIFGGTVIFDMAILKRYVMFLWIFLPVMAFGQSDTGKIDECTTEQPAQDEHYCREGHLQ